MSNKGRLLFFGGCLAAAGAISASTVLILASKGYIDIQEKNKTKVKKSQGTNSNATIEIEKLKEIIKNKEEEIKKAKKKSEEKNGEAVKDNAKLKKTIEAREADIKKLKKEIEDKEASIKNLTPHIKFTNAPNELNIQGVNWDGAFVYKDSIAAKKQYVATKSGVFEYSATTPDEFKKIDEFDGIGDITGGFMFTVSEFMADSYIFIGTKTGLYVVHTDNANGGITPKSKQLIASGDYTNTNMIDEDVTTGTAAYIYDKKGSLLKLKINVQTKKWEFDKTTVVKNLPTKFTGVKTVRDNEDDNGVMYIYGDDGITAISANDMLSMDIKKITSKPVQNINILTKTIDFENIDGAESNFKLGIVFKDSIGFMNPITNDAAISSGEWLKNIPAIKEIKVKGNLTDAKVEFIKGKSEMIPALITKAGIKILVGDEWIDSLKQDGTKETTDFTKSMTFDASSMTTIVNGKELKNIGLTNANKISYTSKINNIY